MSFGLPQQVGGRVRISNSQQQHGANLYRSEDYLAAAGQNNSSTSSYRTTVRRSAKFDSAPVANPFLPRHDRGLLSTGSHGMPRSSATLGGAGGRSRSSLYQSAGAGNGDGGMALGFGRALPSGSVRSIDGYGAIGGVGAWPLLDSQGVGSGTTLSRPKSPVQRSASPHQGSKKLPSFLLGSAQSNKLPTTATSAYAPESSLSSIPVTANTALKSGRVSIQHPMSSLPISPRATRRLSGFGSNDMLSSAYSSSTAANTTLAARGTSALDDAPPIMTLDEMDTSNADSFAHPESSAMHSPSMHVESGDPFAVRSETGAGAIGSENPTEAESSKNYHDVKIRSVVVSGIPAETENSTLNYFKGFGAILAFDVIPSAVAANSIAILYAEPWQAQRAVGQSDSNGRILLGGRTLLRVSAADNASASLLFKQVFPDQALPNSAVPPSASTFTLSETLYAQSPHKPRFP
ncbi:hypothetical protein LPJ73_002737, partial [Coemansia sp. RSA 2703]